MHPEISILISMKETVLKPICCLKAATEKLKHFDRLTQD